MVNSGIAMEIIVDGVYSMCMDGLYSTKTQRIELMNMLWSPWIKIGSHKFSLHVVLRFKYRDLRMYLHAFMCGALHAQLWENLHLRNCIMFGSLLFHQSVLYQISSTMLFLNLFSMVIWSVLLDHFGTMYKFCGSGIIPQISLHVVDIFFRIASGHISLPHVSHITCIPLNTKSFYMCDLLTYIGTAVSWMHFRCYPTSVKIKFFTLREKRINHNVQTIEL